MLSRRKLMGGAIALLGGLLGFGRKARAGNVPHYDPDMSTFHRNSKGDLVEMKDAYVVTDKQVRDLVKKAGLLPPAEYGCEVHFSPCEYCYVRTCEIDAKGKVIRFED